MGTIKRAIIFKMEEGFISVKAKQKLLEIKKKVVTLVHCWWECGLVQPLWETVWSFFKKLKMKMPYEPVIPLLGLCPKDSETPIQKNLCTPMFIAVLFIIAKCWKQPKCPSVNAWVKKLWYIYTMEYLSLIHI